MWLVTNINSRVSPTTAFRGCNPVARFYTDEACNNNVVINNFNVIVIINFEHLIIALSNMFTLIHTQY